MLQYKNLNGNITTFTIITVTLFLLIPLAGALNIPGNFWASLSAYDKATTLTIALLIFSCVAAVRAIIAIKCAPSFSNYLLLIAILLGLASCFQAELPKYAFLGWSRLTGALLLCLVIFYAKKNISDFTSSRILFQTLFTLTFISTLGFYIKNITQLECLIPFCGGRFFPWYDNIRHYNTYLIPAIITLPFINRFLPKRPLVTITYYITAALAYSIVLTTNSRSTLLSLLIALIFIYFFSKDLVKTYAKRILLFLMAGYFIHFLYWGVYFAISNDISIFSLFSSNNELTRTNTSDRSTLWLYAIDLFLRKPILGVGPLHFSYWGWVESDLLASPHSWFFALLAEWGIASILLSTALILELIKIFSHQKKNLGHTLIIAALLASLVDGLFSGGFIEPIFFLLALALPSPSKHEHNHSLYLQYATLLMPIATLFALSKGIYPDILIRNFDNQSIYKLENGKISPRFWVQGYFGRTDQLIKQIDAQEGTREELSKP